MKEVFQVIIFMAIVSFVGLSMFAIGRGVLRVQELFKKKVKSLALQAEEEKEGEDSAEKEKQVKTDLTSLKKKLLKLEAEVSTLKEANIELEESLEKANAEIEGFLSRVPQLSSIDEVSKKIAIAKAEFSSDLEERLKKARESLEEVFAAKTAESEQRLIKQVRSTIPPPRRVLQDGDLTEILKTMVDLTIAPLAEPLRVEIQKLEATQGKSGRELDDARTWVEKARTALRKLNSESLPETFTEAYAEKEIKRLGLKSLREQTRAFTRLETEFPAQREAYLKRVEAAQKELDAAKAAYAAAKKTNGAGKNGDSKRLRELRERLARLTSVTTKTSQGNGGRQTYSEIPPPPNVPSNLPKPG